MPKKDTLQNNLLGQTQLMDAIKANDEHTLKLIYKDNFYKTQQYILNNSGSVDEAKDIFQEAFVTVWENIQDNKFVPQNTSALNGYLYTVAKNKWLNHLNSVRFKKTKSYDTNKHTIDTETVDVKNNTFEKEKDVNTVTNAFNRLGEACKKLLEAFYYENKSLRDIAKIFEITEASARNKKYRCTEQLRALVVKK
jgi:RNA polymerase sigma-70 factor (ECF subfamily)